MKKNRLAIIFLAFLVIITAVFGLFYLFRSKTEPTKEKNTFSLSLEYYKKAEFRDIDAEEFQQLIDKKKSFIVVARMFSCPAGMPMATNSEEIANKDHITIFSLYQEPFKQTELANTIKYLPTAAIYKNGKLVAWLDAESDDDLQYYSSPEGFESWLEQYITLDPYANTNPNNE